MTKHAILLPTNSVAYPSRETRDEFSTSGRKRLSNFARSLKRFRSGRRKLFASTPPSPRLVGIEPNPGPPKSATTKKKSGSSVNVNINETVKSSSDGRKRSRGPRSSSSTIRVGGGAIDAAFRYPSFKTSNTATLKSPPTVNTYLNALRAPFTAPQPRLGFGTFVPTMKFTGWSENTSQSISSGATSFCVSFRPSIASNALVYYNDASSSTTLALSGIAVTSLANSVALGTQLQTLRVISAELRVKVRCPATSLPGTLGGLFVPDDSITNLQANSYAMITAKQKYVPFTSEGQSIGGAVQYRPTDPSSFTFSPILGSNNALGNDLMLPNLIIVGTGWASSNFAIEITCVANFESLSGLDNSGQVEFEPSLVTSGVTIDAVGERLLESGPAVIPSITALEMVDYGLSHAMSRSTFSTGSSIGPGRSSKR